MTDELTNDCVTEHFCFACGTELVHVFKPKFYPEIPNAKFDPFTGHKLDIPQFRDALTVIFRGGYGEYFDDNDVPVIICNTCVQVLRDSVPWVEHLLDWISKYEYEDLEPFFTKLMDVEISKANHPTNHEALGKLLHADPKTIVKPFLSLVKDQEQ